MKRNKGFILILCLALVALITLGCSNSQTPQAKVESGVINKDYVGTVAPVLPQDYKVDEQAKQEMMKVTAQDQPAKEGETDDEAKPKI